MCERRSKSAARGGVARPVWTEVRRRVLTGELSKRAACPQLQTILADAFERADPGATFIVPMAARNGVNLRTHLERVITKAGHKTWPRLFQNLRASYETDWVERYPAHAVAKWLGHSPNVAAEHYPMSREHHFEDVVGGAGPGTPGGCDANCNSAGVRSGRHAIARNDGTRGSHKAYRGFIEDDADFRNRPSGQHRIRIPSDFSGKNPEHRVGVCTFVCSWRNPHFRA